MRTRSIALALLLAAALGLPAGDRMNYIYKNGDRSTMRINGAWSKRLGEVVRKYGNEFVWVQTNGRSYVIRDAATLAEVRAAFRDCEALEPSMREVERRMKPFEDEMETIEERVDTLGDSLDDEDLTDRTRQSIEDKLAVAEREMADVERRMAGIEREMEKIEKEMERVEKIAEARFEQVVERAIDRGIAERVD